MVGTRCRASELTCVWGQRSAGVLVVDSRCVVEDADEDEFEDESRTWDSGNRFQVRACANCRASRSAASMLEGFALPCPAMS